MDNNHNYITAAVELGLVLGDLQNIIESPTINNPFLTSYDHDSKDELISGKLDHIMSLLEQVRESLGPNDPSVLSIQDKIYRIMNKVEKIVRTSEWTSENISIPGPNPENSTTNLNPFLEPHEISHDASTPQEFHTAPEELASEMLYSPYGPEQVEGLEFRHSEGPDRILQGPPSRRVSTRTPAPSGTILEEAEVGVWKSLKHLTTLPGEYVNWPIVNIQNLEQSIADRLEDYMDKAALLAAFYERSGRATDLRNLNKKIEEAHTMSMEALRVLTMHKAQGVFPHTLSTIDEESCDREETTSSVNVELLPTPDRCVPETSLNNWVSRLAEMDQLLSSPFLSCSRLSDIKADCITGSKIHEASGMNTSLVDATSRLNLNSGSPQETHQDSVAI